MPLQQSLHGHETCYCSPFYSESTKWTVPALNLVESTASCSDKLENKLPGQTINMLTWLPLTMNGLKLLL